MLSLLEETLSKLNDIASETVGVFSYDQSCQPASRQDKDSGANTKNWGE